MPQPELTMGLAEASKADVARVGGKAANLGELIDKGYPVPGGFVITTDAYTLFTGDNALQKIVEGELSAIDHSDPRSVEEHAARIREAIEKAKLPKTLSAEIKERYEKMG